MIYNNNCSRLLFMIGARMCYIQPKYVYTDIIYLLDYMVLCVQYFKNYIHVYITK